MEIVSDTFQGLLQILKNVPISWTPQPHSCHCFGRQHFIFRYPWPSRSLLGQALETCLPPTPSHHDRNHSGAGPLGTTQWVPYKLWLLLPRWTPMRALKHWHSTEMGYSFHSKEARCCSLEGQGVNSQQGKHWPMRERRWELLAHKSTSLPLSNRLLQHVFHTTCLEMPFTLEEALESFVMHQLAFASHPSLAPFSLSFTVLGLHLPIKH